MRKRKWNYFLLVIVAFIGFIIGRFTHYYFGGLGFHHWILALLMIIGGIIFIKYQYVEYVIAFGIGLFVSDLNDFLAFRIYGFSPADSSAVKNFWSID